VSDYRKILIFRQSSLGDVVLTLPLIQRLYESFPNCLIDYITKSPYAAIIRCHRAVRKVHSFDGDSEFYRLARSLNNEKYDLFLDLQLNLRSYALGLLASPAKIVRYKKRRIAREMVVRRAHLKLAVDQTVNAYFSTLRSLGISGVPSPSFISLPNASSEYIENLLRERGLQGKTLIAICPGAKHYEKRWPHSDFKNVALSLLKQEEIGIVVISSASDEIPIRLGIDHPRLLELRDEAILNVAALFARCRLALTNDSGLMHLANAAGTPVLAIFGPTNPRLGFSPILPGSEIICDNVFCSPCSVHGQKPCCQPEKYCFQKITHQRVVDKLLGMLKTLK